MSIEEFIDAALREDVGAGDHTSLACIKADARGKAIVKVKEDGIIAGLVLAGRIFNRVDNSLKIEVLAKDGAVVKPGEIVIKIEGSIRSMLTAERLVLNCMQRMSGIATTSHANI